MNRGFISDGKANAVVAFDIKTLQIIKTIPVTGQGPDGIIYDPFSKRIFAFEGHSNSVAVVDTKALKVVKSYPLDPCGGPTGLALDKSNQRLFTVCREDKGMSVIDVATGKVVQTLSIGSGVDAVVYDAVNKLVIASNGDGTASIFKQNSADSYALLQTLKTQYHAKTMALDAATHQIYFPVSDYKEGNKIPVPGSFKLLVYQLKD